MFVFSSQPAQGIKFSFNLHFQIKRAFVILGSISLYFKANSCTFHFYLNLKMPFNGVSLSKVSSKTFGGVEAQKNPGVNILANIPYFFPHLFFISSSFFSAKQKKTFISSSFFNAKQKKTFISFLVFGF